MNPISHPTGYTKTLLLTLSVPEFAISTKMSIKFACKSYSFVPPINIIPYLSIECKNYLHGIIVAPYLLTSLIFLTIPSS